VNQDSKLPFYILCKIWNSWYDISLNCTICGLYFSEISILEETTFEKALIFSDKIGLSLANFSRIPVVPSSVFVMIPYKINYLEPNKNRHC